MKFNEEHNQIGTICGAIAALHHGVLRFFVKITAPVVRTANVRRFNSLTYAYSGIDISSVADPLQRGKWSGMTSALQCPYSAD